MLLCCWVSFLEGESVQTKTRPLFPLGVVLATPGALKTVSTAETIAAVKRHRGGDWGTVCEDDKEANDRAIGDGGRLLSAYETAEGRKFWIITEADRSCTTILLPEEY